MSGWTVQYASASSTSWSATALTGSIGPGRYWIWAQDPFTHKTSEKKLVDLAGTTSVDVDLPVP